MALKCLPGLNNGQLPTGFFQNPRSGDGSGDFWFKACGAKAWSTDYVAISNLQDEGRTSEDALRSDLFYRLAALRITVPPLRQRGFEEVLEQHSSGAGEAARLDLWQEGTTTDHARERIS